MYQLINRWIALSFVMALLVACVGNSPSSVVRSFYKNIENGEITKAMEALPQEVLMFGEPKIRKSLEKQTETFSQMGGIKSIDAKDDCKGEVCFVDTKVIFNNGKEISERIKMSKENGKWKTSAKSLF